jgi:esterase/lipase
MSSSHQKTCFILLPGFAPDYSPVLALKRTLEKYGYAVTATNFFGDIIVEDFKKLSIQECQENISDIINRATLKYDRVIGIGVSLGGALLLEHAKTKNNLYGIVSIGTPFKLKYRQLMSIGEFLLPTMYPIWKHFEKFKHLRLLPIGAGPAVIRYLENRFLQKLENIQIPVLFLHSKKDLVTDYRALPEFSEKISSKHKDIILSENGSHVIDHDPKYIFEHLAHFFDLI